MERFESSLSAHTHFSKAGKAPLRSLWDGGEFFDALFDEETESDSAKSQTNGMTLESRESMFRILDRLASTQMRATPEEIHVQPSWMDDFEPSAAAHRHSMAERLGAEKMRRLGDVHRLLPVDGGVSNHS